MFATVIFLLTKTTRSSADADKPARRL